MEQLWFSTQAIQGPVIVYIIYILLYLGLLNDAIGVVVVCLFVLYVFNIALDWIQLNLIELNWIGPLFEP